MVKAFTKIGLSLLVFSCFGGCGGGGSAPPSGSSDRLAMVESVRAKFDTLAGQSRDAQNQTILQFIQANPSIATSGITDDHNVWARFKDGRLLVVINNRTNTGDSSLTGRIARVTRGAGLPGTDTVRMFSGFAVSNVSNSIGPSLTKGGYSVAQSVPATLDNLMAVKDSGVFYVDCHGAVVPNPDGSNVFYAVSDTPYSQAIEDQFKGDAPNSLDYAIVMDHSSLARDLLLTRTLVIYNSDFVLKHFKFGPDSFVFFNCCHGFDADFYNACLMKGASVYASWTQSADDGVAGRAAKFLFDRLLGANQYPESPLQRPFDYAAILQDMQRRGLAVSPRLNEAGGDALLQFVEANQTATPGFGLLAPSIRSINVIGIESADRHITLAGTFGDAQGTVTIGGEDVPVRTWTRSTITLDLNRASADVHGDVVVKVRAHESNHIPLTLWTGQFTVKLQAQGTLTRTVQIQAHLVAAVMKTRARPGDPPSSSGAEPQRGDFLPDKATTATVSADGQDDSTGDTVAWLVNGANNLPGGFDPDRRYSISGQIDLDTRVLTLSAGAGGFLRNGLETRTTHNGSTFSAFSDYDTAFPDLVTINLDSNYNIPAGFQVGQGPDLGSGPTVYTVQWGAITAQSPPMDANARAAKTK